MTALIQKVYLIFSNTFAKNRKNMGRIEAHNREIVANAQYRAEQMKAFPSPLEEKMIELLDENGADYEFQKIFYIYADDGWIMRYYIADFYLPKDDLIIEVDGKFHEDRKQHDKNRTKEIQEHYPEVEVLRYTWKDMSDYEKMDDLLWRIHQL